MSALMPWQSARQNSSGHDIHINTDTHPHSTIFWPARVENPPNLPIFSNLDAVKAHMHIQHKQGLKSRKVSNRQSTKCYTKYQELINEGIVKKDITHFGKCLWRKKKMSCSAQEGIYFYFWMARTLFGVDPPAPPKPPFRCPHPDKKGTNLLLFK
jgi:hypothetical protein